MINRKTRLKNICILLAVPVLSMFVSVLDVHAETIKDPFSGNELPYCRYLGWEEDENDIVDPNGFYYNEDGSISQYMEKNENGTLAKYITYDENGVVRSYNEYDENGKYTKYIGYVRDQGLPIIGQEYKNGKLIKLLNVYSNEEAICTEYDESGREIKQTNYNSDGSFAGDFIHEYDGNTETETQHISDGSVFSVAVINRNDEGKMTGFTKTFSDGSIWCVDYYENGQISKNYNKEADGTAISREFDEAGKKTRVSYFYSNGQLAQLYEYDENEKLVSYKYYNKYGEQVDFAGNLIEDKEADNEENSTIVMLRLYNPNTGEHFYTSSEKEKNALVNQGWNYEGKAWEAPKWSNTPVYRLYNRNSGDHHYTPSKKERDNLIKQGWDDEGIGWYSDDNKSEPLFRLYNPNATTGQHHYTTSAREQDWLVQQGWQDEGVGWYGL